MKRVFTSILAAMIIATSLVACKTEDPSKTNTPTEATTENVTEVTTEAKTEAQTEAKKPSNLPTSVDWRNYKGKNYVTPTKVQIFGDCWTFATIAAVETAYLYANDLGVTGCQSYCWKTSAD